MVDVLEELEKTQKEFWNIDKATGMFLSELIKQNKCVSILEIGTSNGYSTIWLARSTKGKVLTIETWQERIEQALQNFKKAKLENIELKQGDALEIIPELKQEIDFLFIDGKKREYLEYLKLCIPKLKNNALIVADNVISHKEKTQDFLDFVESNFPTELVEIGDGLSVSRFQIP